MITNSRFWAALTNTLSVAQNFIRSASLASQVVCPFLEALLLSLAFLAPSGSRWLPISVLAIVVAFHIIFAIAVLRAQSSAPASTLAEAVRIEAELQNARDEIRRRGEAYAIVRQAFTLLNNQTCAVIGSGDEKHWCDKGFKTAIEPILATLIAQINVALGLKGNVFSVELYLRGSNLPPYTGKDDPRLVFLGGTVGSEKIAPVDADYSLVNRGWGSRPFQQHINQSPNWYYEDDKGEKVKEGVYYRRMVTAPVFLACSPDTQIGLFAVTSMQEEPFAADASDMLAFYAAIITNFVYAFGKCYEEKQQMEHSDLVVEEKLNDSEPPETPGVTPVPSPP